MTPAGNFRMVRKMGTFPKILMLMLLFSFYLFCFCRPSAETIWDQPVQDIKQYLYQLFIGGFAQIFSSIYPNSC